MASLWGGRFEKDMDDIVKKYTDKKQEEEA